MPWLAGPSPLRGKKHILSGLLLLGGVLLLLGLGLLRQQLCRQAVRDYGLAHQVAGQQGMLRWLYNNPFLVGEPRVSIRPAPRLHRDHTPRRRQRPYPFSWRWLALLQAPRSGEYVFDLYVAEAVRLYLDGRPLVQRWVGHPDRHIRVMVRLEAGPHLLDLQNVQRRRRLDLTLMWAPPGADRLRVIPGDYLRPLDRSVTVAALTRLYRSLERWWALTWLLPLMWLAFWWLVLRDPARARRVLWEHRWFLLVLGVAAVLRLLWAEVVHGVSGEEAYFGYRAQLILEGSFPFNGMTERTGPLFDYLLALPWAVFGPSAWLLRVMGVLPNLLALVFCYRVVDREAGRSAALAVSLLYAVLPALVIFARMPGDNTSLGPLMFFWGLDLVSLSRGRPPLAVLAGILWGLASFNHSIFVILPFTLGLSALVVTRLRVLRHLQVWGMGLGFCLGFLPRVATRILHQPRDAMSFWDLGRMEHLGFFLKMFASSLDGQLAYLTFVGRRLWDNPWITPVVLVLAGLVLAWGIWRRRAADSWLGAWIMLALVLHLLLVPLGAPSANTRYYLYCLIFAVLIMGLAWGRALAWSPRSWRLPLVAALVLFALFNTVNLGINYLYAHHSTGGSTAAWDTPLLDHTPDAWMNHRELARELARRGLPVVATADYWHHTLDLALNLYQGEPLVFSAQPFASRSDTEAAACFYNSREGRTKEREFFQGHGRIRGHKGKSYVRLYLGQYLDGKYRCYRRVSPPVTYPDDWEEKP